MESIEQYLSILKELSNIEVRVNRLAQIFSQNGRTEIDDLLISGINLKATQLVQAATNLSNIQQNIPQPEPTQTDQVNSTEQT